jgi:type IV pilus assembly protein PilA
MLTEMKKNQKGFTLVELIVVIAIMAILATLLIPRIMGNVKEAANQTQISTARTLASEITIWNAKASTDNDTTTKTIPATFPTTGTTAVAVGDLTNGNLTLPTGTEFPDATVVEIVVDKDGNASLNIK